MKSSVQHFRTLKLLEMHIDNATVIISIYILLRNNFRIWINLASLLLVRDITFSSANTQQMLEKSRQADRTVENDV